MEEIIRKIPLFSMLPATMLQQEIDGGGFYLKKYAKGATLKNQNDVCTTLDIVLSGRFITYSLTENGSAMQVFEFCNKEILGANLLFGDDNAYPLSIYCDTDGQILHLSKSAVSVFLQDYNFVIEFVGMLSQNSQRLNKKMQMVLHKTLRDNLLEYLHEQSQLQQSNTIMLPISKKQLADYLGVQRPSLFRELKNLKEQGIIEVIGTKIKLKIINNSKTSI